MKVFKDIEQGSEDWLRIRAGKPTSSRFGDIITAVKGELSKSSKGYIRELIGACFCPDFEYFSGNRFTEHGKQFEPEARAQFVAHTGHVIEQVGFCLSDDGVSGCSPDALCVNADGEYYAGVEIKCPSPKTHVGYVLDGVLPDDYKQQVHGSMAVTGLNSWHFWSYLPGMKPLHVEVQRDEYTQKLSDSLASFVAEYKATMAAALPKLKI